MDEFEVFQDYVAYNASLQQQNQQLIEGLKEMTESDDDWYVGRVAMKAFAERLLESIQGGNT